MYYDYTYRGKIPPQAWNTPKHLRYKNGRLGGKNPALVRVYTTPLPKGLHKERPDQRYFLVRSEHLSEMDSWLRLAVRHGISHEDLQESYETWKKTPERGPRG
jgi:hypothetical protein